MVKRYRIPPTGALVAFESAARLLNFSRAAEELNTAQSAVSRHIAELESRLDTTLFIRNRSGSKRLVLSEQGELLYRSVVSGLEILQSGILAIQQTREFDEFVIACTHEISHLFLMPRFDQFQSVIGDGIQVRIMTSEYTMLESSPDPRIDLMFSYNRQGHDDNNLAVICKEAIKPVCSPGYLDQHQSIILSPPENWQRLTFLSMAKLNPGWATWQEWFERNRFVDFDPDFQVFDNYVYILEAAAAGRGLALGWKGLIERYLESGTLVSPMDHYLESDRALYAILTDKGTRHPSAPGCIDYLTSVLQDV